MKKFSRMAGVTLLEVMLVLAVAAMIIVMSIRYYQSATTGQQVTGALNMLQGIQANMDGLAQGTGSYASITNSQVTALMPSQSMTAPWGVDATAAGTAGNTFEVIFNSMPNAVCLQVNSRIAANSKWAAATCGSPTSNATYVYTATN